MNNWFKRDENPTTKTSPNYATQNNTFSFGTIIRKQYEIAFNIKMLTLSSFQMYLIS
jgi:hypothetical protein